MTDIGSIKTLWGIGYMAKNILAIVRQERIRDICLGMINTLRRFDIHMEIYEYQRMQRYWQERLNATDEDIHKADGPIRAPKQTR